MYSVTDLYTQAGLNGKFSVRYILLLLQKNFRGKEGRQGGRKDGWEEGKERKKVFCLYTFFATLSADTDHID